MTEMETKGVEALFVGSDLTDEGFEQIRQHLLHHCALDLASYKDQCIRRRIASRVRTLGYTELPPYLERLHRDEGEAAALLAALSIHVSQFFRNPSTFQALKEQYLPLLIRQAAADGRRELRLWSAGCAGGEEPYSLALLLEELLPATMHAFIHATDISPMVLERARQGVFDEARLAEIPPQTRTQYFTREGDLYRLSAAMRARVSFTGHDLLDAAPYPAADLIMCRNVLIYFSREEQEKILHRFAAALPESGILVLGRTETLVGESRTLFHAESSSERIYTRTGVQPEPQQHP